MVDNTSKTVGENYDPKPGQILNEVARDDLEYNHG